MKQQVAISIISALVGAFIALALDNRRHMREVLKLHHGDIKDRILQPIIELTADFYKPCFDSNDNPLEKHPHLWEFSIRDPQHEFSYRQSFGESQTPGYYRHRGFEESVLFRDALKHHFPELLADWTDLRNSYLQYARDAKEIACEDRKILKASLGIASRTPNDDPKPGLNYSTLAFALLNKRLGFDDRTIILIEGMQTTEVRLWTQDTIGTIQTTDVKRFRELWANLAAKNNPAIELKSRALKAYSPLAQSILERARWEKESLRSLNRCALT